MTWKKIIDQKRVKKILQTSVTEGRIAHAYCFWGLEGIGKEGLAIEFAKTLNCKNPIIKGWEIEACETCSSCRQANILQHPNIQLIFSLPASSSATTKNDGAMDKLSEDQLNQIKEQINLKSLDYYHKIILPNATQIKVASVRDIKKNLNLSSSYSGRRCIIISRAEEMTSESANAFLKSLEEPSENTTIILTTSRHEAVLPTILSRCQQIRCESLSEDEISDYMMEKLSIDSTQAKLVAAFSQGSYTKALEFLDSDMKEMREEVVETLRCSLRKRAYRLELGKRIEELSKIKDKNKHETFLNLLLIWLRDVSSVAAGNQETIINIDQIETINRFANNFRDKDFSAAISRIERSIQLIRRNVQLNLIHYALFIKLREIFF